MSELTANLLYHAARFTDALDLCDRLEPTLESQILAIKSAIELDQLDKAEALARQGLAMFPKDGKIYYYRGVVAVLSWNIATRSETAEDWFRKAIDLGMPEACMGLGLVAHQKFRYQEALGQLLKVTSEDPELEHARLLKLFQTYLALGMEKEAEEIIIRSRCAVAQMNSFVRLMWSEIHGLKLLWLKRQTDVLRLQLSQTLATVEPRMMPRLYRALLELRRLLDLPTPAAEAKFPADQLDDFPLDAIANKPVLYELYEYLRSSGARGADKQTIVHRIWQEQYNPLIHDSRLYKAVARLRKILGDNAKSPRMIVLKGRTYFLNIRAN